MNKLKVTFVMPAYNAEQFISKAIDSVLSQTSDDWKLIVVNDGSTDATQQIVRDFEKKDSRIRLINMEKASGSAYQPRKRGILEAETPWVAPLDADDYIEPDYLKKLIDKQSLLNSDAVYPSMWRDINNNISPLILYNDKLSSGNLEGKSCVGLTLVKWKINCNGGIIKRDFYLKAFDRLPADICYSCADELLTRHLLFTLDNVSFSEARYFYRCNPESITNKKSLKLIDYSFNNEALLEFTRINYGETSNEYYLANLQAFLGYFQAARLLYRYNFNSDEVLFIKNRTEKLRKITDLSLINKEITPYYRLLFSKGIKFASAALKLSDSLKKFGQVRKVNDPRKRGK